MTLILRLLKETHHLNRYLLLSIISASLCTIFQFSLLLLTLRALIQPTANQLWPMLAIILGLGLLIGITRYGEQYSGHYVAFKILSDFRIRLYRHLITLAPARLDDHHSSQLLKTITQDINAIEVFYAHTITPIATAMIILIFQGVVFGHYAIWLGLTAVISYLLIGLLLPWGYARLIAPVTPRLAKADRQNQKTITELISNQFVLQQHGLTNWAQKQANQTNATYAAGYRQKANLQSQQTVVITLFLTITTATFGWLVIKTHQPIWLAILFPLTFQRFLSLANLPGALSNGLAASKAIFNLLDEKPDINDNGTQTLSTGQSAIQVVANNLNFTYPKRPTDRILAHFNLTAVSPKIIGLIGKSGTGKSTFLKLLMRWYDPQSGTITIDGTPIQNLTLASLRQSINYMAQEPIILEGTVWDNLTLGKSFPEAKINDLLTSVRMKTVVDRLEHGLDTPISPRSNPFSAGETQRLSLVRALLYPSQILLLDEPTSNLDSINEAIILKTVKKHYHGLVLLVTHRKSSLAICDQVLDVGSLGAKAD
ncbi:amino acid ABC transporter ATP-binding/permease protein [Lentilactobacillus raoultii]|uniref:Amino acid ABC transporter ATP-binding/permease protein n=1 Tax=Lentilactobacillus raoultii TaxID=1987503 RepID=A0ABW3PKB6_9LACO|nr:ABC transporter ATP-binding protein [Lentilactobacillus raoultii]